MSILRSCRVVLGALLLLGTASAAAQELPAPAQSHGRQFHTHFSFHNTDIAKLLRRLERFGLKVPVAVSGRATTRVDVSVPLDDLFRGSDYRIRATMDSDRLLIAGQDLRAVHAQLTYAGGVLELADFEFDLAPLDNNPAPTGRITGSGQMQVVPRGDLRLQLRMQGVLVDRLAASLPLLKGASGRIDGDVSAAAPVNALKTPNAWAIQGQATVSHLAIVSAPPLDGQARFQLQQGRLDVTRLHVASGNASVDGTAQIQAAAPYAFRTALELSLPQLQAWQPWLAKFVALPWTLKGLAKLSAQASGTLDPIQLSAASGKIQAGNLALGPLAIARLQGDLATDGRNAVLRNLQISVYGGSLEGSLSVPLARTGPLALDVTWSGIQVAKGAAAAGLALPIAATAAGRMSARVPLERLQTVLAWSASGSVALGGVQVYAWRSNQTAAAFQLTEGRLSISNLAGDLDRGRMTGSLGLELAAPYRTTANFELVNGDLAPFNSLPGRLHPPLNVVGRYSVRTSVQGTLVPLDAQATGGFLAQGARLGTTVIDRVSLLFRASRNAVGVDDFQATLFGGQAAGSAAISLTAAGPPGEATLRWQGLDLAALSRLDPQLQLSARGRASGSVQLRVPAGRLTEWSDWTAQGHAQVDGLGLATFDLGRLSADFGLREKKVQATRLELIGPMGSIQASAQVGLTAPLDYTARLQVTQANLAVLTALPQATRRGTAVSGQLAGRIDVQGTLQPLAITGKANISATDVVVSGAKLDRATVEAHFDRRRVELTTAEAVLYDGRATASGTVNLDDASRLRAEMKGVNLAKLASALGYAPGHLAAVADGSLAVEIPRGALPRPDAWQVQADLEIPKIMAGKAYLGMLHAKADYRQDALSYEADGELLGGTLSAKGQLQPGTGKQPFSLGTGHLLLSGAQLDQAAALTGRPALLPLSGKFTVSADFHAPRRGESTIGSGNWSLADVHWNQQVLISRLGGAIRITPQRLDLVDTQGALAGGTLLLAGTFDLAHPAASVFSLELMDARLAQLSSLVGHPMAVQGTLGLALRGNLARPWQIYGTAVIGQGQLAGIRLADARLSLAAAVDPLTGSGRFAVTQATASVANGSVTGKLKADFRGQLSIQASASFNNVDLRALSGQLASAGRLVSGKVSGSLAVSGQNVRSLDDLSGTLKARLSRAQAMGLPLLNSVGPFMSGISTATVFDDGRLSGSFSHGVLRVRRFTLSSSSLQVFADGTITSKLRLNLNVTASTGQQGSGGLLSTMLLAEMPLFGPTPIGLLIEANRLLANQTINLVVGGTASHPSISIRPGPLLAEEAVRFFLLQAPGASALVP